MEVLFNYLYNLDVNEGLLIIQGSVSVLAVFLSYVTLRLARKAQKAIVKNHSLNRQLDSMTELIKHLNDSKISISFWELVEDGGHGSGVPILYNIFEIGELQNNKELHPVNQQPYDRRDFDDMPIYFTKNSNQLLEIKQFIDNPFIPKSIADELMNFYSPAYKIIEGELLGKNCESIVTVTTKIFEKKAHEIREEFPSDSYLDGNAFALLTWLNLKTHSNNFTKQVDTWFKSHGINDVNLRVDYKNVSY